MKNKVDLVVLGFLCRMPMHGYQIAEFFKKRGIEFWVTIKQPSVYKALNRLVKDGHLECSLKVEENERLRKVYHITEKGRKYFKELLEGVFFSDKFISPHEFWNAFRFLSGNVDKPYFKSLIKHRLGKIDEHHKEMMERRQIKIDENDEFQLPYYLKMLMNHFHRVMQQERELLEEMLSVADLKENEDSFIKNTEE